MTALISLQITYRKSVFITVNLKRLKEFWTSTKVSIWSSMKTPIDTSFSLQVSMAKMNESAEETLRWTQESSSMHQGAPSGAVSVRGGHFRSKLVVNAEWPSAGCARVSLAINYFYSCCSKNRRDKNCPVCSTESAKRTSKKKPTSLCLSNESNKLLF